MSGLFSSVPILNRLTGLGSGSTSVNLPSVEVHHVETDPDKRARCLKHLIKGNHVNYAVVYHNLQFDNHTPHVLGSAYLLGANDAQLNHIYEEEVKELEPWRPSPAEVVDNDWKDFWGEKEYQRAYLDFFEDKLALEFAYDWKKTATHFLFDGDQPLFHGLIGGLGHPLIHLGYAYELDSKEVGMEALTLASVQYNFLHKYIDEKSYTRASPLKSESPLDLLIKLSEDKRFDSLPENPELGDMEKIFNKYESTILEYWNGWEITNPTKQFQLSQEAAVAVLVSTVRPDAHDYNFFLVHLLTTSHAVRILLPFFPPEHHITLVREWWLLVLAVFIVKDRPRPDPSNLEDGLQGKTWKHVEHEALTSKWSTDAHYVKGIRAMKEAAKTWGDEDQQYLRAAVTFVNNFQGWDF